MLQEQRAEVEELYEARAVRLESLLEEWKKKHAALRRRFSLETEGFRRDADNIGRYVRVGRAVCLFRSRRAWRPRPLIAARRRTLGYCWCVFSVLMNWIFSSILPRSMGRGDFMHLDTTCVLLPRRVVTPGGWLDESFSVILICSRLISPTPIASLAHLWTVGMPFSEHNSSVKEQRRWQFAVTNREQP